MDAPLTEIVATYNGIVLYSAALPPGEYEIGREITSNIRLKSDGVSRPHARLTLSYFDWKIEDLQSHNGTYVGGERIRQPTFIFPHQEVQVARVQLKLRRLPPLDSDESRAPQVMVAMHYLPPELRDQRRYRVRRTIAVGGMGVILEAEDRATLRTVAMKTLLTTESVENVARFVEEAQITAQLQHPNIVPVYELNVNELEKPYYTMQLVRGESLKRVLHSLRLARPETLQTYRLEELLIIFQKICDAIAFAHSKGVVHRDLKPGNIMLGDYGEVLVMDWGLAKPLGENANRHLPESPMRTLVSSARQGDPGGIGTTPGLAVGTPQYMSPEQAQGRSHSVDARADIYALGAILYSILTLQPPFDGLTTVEILKQVVAGRITPPARALQRHALPHLPEGRLPDALVAIALKAMSLSRDARYATVRELQEQVRQYQFGERHHPERPWASVQPALR